jgi:hypothetical protein
VAERLYCVKGHYWEPVFRPDVWPPDFRSSCPVCGEAPIAPGELTVTGRRVAVVLGVVVVLAGVAWLVFATEPMPCGLFLLIIGVILLALAGPAAWAVRQRRKKVAAIAEAMEFAFMPSLTSSSVRAIAPFRLFAQGRLPKACNAMQGRVGDCDVLSFDYQYTTGGGKSSQTHTVSAVIVFDGAAGVPDFQLAPKTFLDKLVGFFSHADVTIEDADEFGSRFKLSGPDEAALRRMFHPDLVQYLGRCFGRDARWFLEVADGQLLVYRTPPVPPDKRPGLVTDALDIRDVLREATRTA